MLPAESVFWGLLFAVDSAFEIFFVVVAVEESTGMND